MKNLLSFLIAVVMILVTPVTLVGANSNGNADSKNQPEIVTQQFQTLLFDAYGGYWFDVNGIIYSNVASPSDLDQKTLSRMTAHVISRGTYVDGYFGPQMVTGWSEQDFKYSGYAYPDGLVHYKYLIVHKSDPRWTGNPNLVAWPDWEFKVLVASHYGNFIPDLIRP